MLLFHSQGKESKARSSSSPLQRPAQTWHWHVLFSQEPSSLAITEHALESRLIRPLCEDKESVDLVLLDVLWICAENVFLGFPFQFWNIYCISTCVPTHGHTYEHANTNPFLFTSIYLTHTLESSFPAWDFSRSWIMRKNENNYDLVSHGPSVLTWGQIFVK